MALACVEPMNQASRHMAAELAARWNVPLRENYQGPKEGINVVISETALGLGFVDRKRGKPYFVDFLSQAWKVRFAQSLPKSHIFRRALGVREGLWRVIDATAGFGQDSVLALCAGCEVTSIEKSSVVVAVLQNGVERAIREDEMVRERFANFKVVEAHAEVYLATAEPADVVYIDPMFDKPKKSAKSPKEMQLLQELLPSTSSLQDDERLFAAAFAHAKSRVVVKCPLKGKALSRAPTHSYKGQSIRYDVYVK